MDKLTVQEYALRAGLSESYVRRCLRKQKINKLPKIIKTEKHGRAYVIYC